jgi:ligand-binding sensor domain-containing protein
MRCAVFSFYVITVFVSSAAFSQEYSYTHYDITEGLAGTTVYCITQDADGFIWVGTETGVSRFDGTHFKNFTTGDGLTDIEVLQIFGDSKGRVWMAPFKKSICYYYRGKIYNPGNDTMLSRIPLKGNIEGFAEDAQGNLLIEERAGLHLVLAGGTVENYDSINGYPIRSCTAICRSSSGHFLVQEGRNIWNFSDSFSFFRPILMQNQGPLFISMSGRGVVWASTVSLSAFTSFESGQAFYRNEDKLHYKHVSFSMPNDGYIYLNEVGGTIQIDPETGVQRFFLPGNQVSKTFSDRDNNLWFTTLNHGIYRLNSEKLRTKMFGSEGHQAASPCAILQLPGSMWIGTDHNQLFQMAVPEFRITDRVKFLPEGKDRVVLIDTFRRGILFCSGYGVSLMTSSLHFISHFQLDTKWACRLNAEELMIGSATGVVIFNFISGLVTDTLSRERSTAGYSNGRDIYFGTMSGLYRVSADRSVVFLGKKIPFLTKRVSSMAVDSDGTLWVASYDDAGIIGVRNNTVVAVLTQKQGLTSDICKTLLVRGAVLWVGTDKGLNAVQLDRPGYPVTRYTSNEGLGSDMVNYLYSSDSMMYAGTTAGLTFFKANAVMTGEPCRLQLLRLINSGADRLADTGNLSLSYRAKDIRFEFVAISYRSAGNIRYRYRLLGLDSNWRETDQNFLDYPSLPSGGYTFQLQATNKFGVESRMLSLPFRVQTPYWESAWFRTLLVVVLTVLTWFLVTWRIRYIRRRQSEREELVRQRAEMENVALQAQMNPHFIFNCLNSIQQFVFDKDVEATNEYISGFARLIRATLNHSSQPFISVAEEVEFLTDYLSLEKMRFKNKMDFSIEVEPGLDVHEWHLPPMLLQPYVENSVRHGLRHKTSGQGHIEVQFRSSGDKLLLTIRDNGIGRKKAMEFKTGEHIEYQSRGMSLTSSRIKMINLLYRSHIVVRVDDMVDELGRSDGTRITMEFPIFR